MEQWQAGLDSEDLFRQIFHQYYRLVFSFFAKRGFSTEESHDLAQETFLRVHKSLANFRGEARLETWLFKVTANVWRNALRSQTSKRRDAEEVSLDQVLAPQTLLQSGQRVSWESQERDPLSGVLAEERLRILHEALQGLPAQMSRCVLLRIDQDLKYREIAELMRVSVETVKAHIFQARQLLKVKLGHYFTDLNF
jgi:RNA polymerase sigma-70 factor (ECF subfamily)